MFRWTASAVLYFSSAASVPTQYELGLHQPVRARIHAGETHRVHLQMPKGMVARVALSQIETDLSIDAPGIHVDTNEYGTEIAYLRSESDAGVLFQVSAEPNEPNTGRFLLQVTAFEADGNHIGERLAAQKFEMEGVTLLDRRRAETHEMAIQKLESAAKLWQLSDEPHREGFCRLSLGRALERNSQFRAADENYLWAIALLKQSGDTGGSIDAEKTWMNLGGHVGEARGSLAALERLLRRAEEHGDRRKIGQFLSSVSSAHHRAGSKPEARDLLARAIRIFDRLGLRGRNAEQLLRLSGMDYEAGDVKQSLRHAEEALATYRELRDEGGELSALGGMAIALDYLNSLEEAAEVFSLLRTRHKARGETSAAASPTLGLAEIERKTGKYESAWRHLIEIRDDTDRHYQRTQKPSAHFAPFGGSDLSTTAKRLATVSDRFARDAFWLIDARRSGFYSGDGGDRVAALQRSLPDDTVLIEYVLAEAEGDDGIVWTVDRRSVIAHPIPGAAEAVRLGRQMVSRLSERVKKASEQKVDLLFWHAVLRRSEKTNFLSH